ncbi:nicotinamide mononucleotide transporter [Massilia violaceinigra]|uniref:Nicotinamide riboside transporter PnuC n=1 Tax=Massilia violaceinigra TaxID=2045208 RepID=A0A2D2DND9_9BURK|nr:nicotinamide riboside transporter PnuC [Massilia violaceinigra]ATQ76508.1 nicotinamide mononucleotide transporter [Massilia violaceinigra]
MIGNLEIAANVGATAAILLAGRNSVHTWWTGIIGCALFSVLFYQSKLYADVALQGFFIVSSVVGWVQWRRGREGSALPISHAKIGALAWIVPAGVAAAAAYGALLHHYTDAYAPFIDSAVLVFSVVAQLLLMQRKVENWAFWILVNTVAVPLYASRGLYLTAFLYACYWVNAIVSWLWWRRLARQGA